MMCELMREKAKDRVAFNGHHQPTCGSLAFLHSVPFTPTPCCIHTMSDGKDALKLVPRAYQEEIFDRARVENVVAALETGSGKTFIAALLIKWIMAQPSQAGRKTVFLVPKVPLVDQQRDFLAEQTPLTVRGYKGAMGVDEWDKARWISEFEQSDCLVMTGRRSLFCVLYLSPIPFSANSQEHPHAWFLEHGPSSLSDSSLLLAHQPANIDSSTSRYHCWFLMSAIIHVDTILITS